MIPQIPAEGILAMPDYGNSMSYAVPCSCGCDDHTHHVVVEADENDITVYTYTTQYTNYWSKYIPVKYNINPYWLQKLHWGFTNIINGLFIRIKLTYKIWVKGYIKYEATLIMTEQQALNYGTALLKSIENMKDLKDIATVTKYE
jgi:hypothetical protein